MDVQFLVYPGFQLLDLSGPAAVFGAVSESGRGEVTIITASAAGEAVISSCGVAVTTTPFVPGTVGPETLLFVVGGEGAGLLALMNDRNLAEQFADAAGRARLWGSICTGAVILASWGLLGGHRVTTHWRAADRLAARHPDIDVDADALFVEDGRLWTSAGVTTGIDMALAIVDRFWGSELAQGIAARFVLPVRRAGHQSQFSPLLAGQNRGDYSQLIGWIGDNLNADLSVEALAARAGQSVRTFQRKFAVATGKSPAALVAAARLDAARALLASGCSVAETARRCGFRNAEHLARRFRKVFDMPPSAFHARHAPTGSAPRRP
ncbi:MAG: helix-turn-helix domain-containing protein [Pacificimonas sp.]